MKPKIKCPHCEKPINDTIIISWGQHCLALKRRRPPDGKGGASNGQKDAPPEIKPKSNPTPDVIREITERQAPPDATAKDKEVFGFALGLFAEAMAAAGSFECFHEGCGPGIPQLLPARAFITGAAAAFVALQRQPQPAGNGQNGQG